MGEVGDIVMAIVCELSESELVYLILLCCAVEGASKRNSCGVK